jgi:hypothetical protein
VGFSSRPTPRFHTNNSERLCACARARGRSSDDDEHEKGDTGSDHDEHEKEEEYSETDIGILGPDYSSSDNDATKHDDDDIESSDHDDQQEEEAQALTADDQEEAQALTAHDDLIAAASVMNDMLDAEWMQQTQQESLQADEALKNKMQGLFDFSKKQFITLPEYKKDTKFAFDISPAKLCDHLYSRA